MKRKDFIKKSAVGMAALAFSNTSFGMIKKATQDEKIYYSFYHNLEGMQSHVNKARIEMTLNNQLKKGDIISLIAHVDYTKNDNSFSSTNPFTFIILEDFKPDKNLKIKHTKNASEMNIEIEDADLDFSEITTLNNIYVKFEGRNDREAILTIKNTNLSYLEFELNEYTPGCYLTTSCVQHKSLPDNCAELTALRNFRDHYMLKQVEGKELIKEYYNIAPSIVKSIQKSENKDEILDFIYNKLVLDSINLIENNEPELAMNYYAAFTKELEKRLIN